MPEHFRFAVKVHKELTCECGLVESEERLDSLAAEGAGLGTSLGVLLVRLPPSVAFDADYPTQFFADLRARCDARVCGVCEPRHRSWFSQSANSVLSTHEVARAAAEPAMRQGRSAGRLARSCLRPVARLDAHCSNYGGRALESTLRDLHERRVRATRTWCIFDNTAAHAALGNALAVRAMNSLR